MEEVRQLVQEEGREARNLVAFHVAVDTPATRVSRKPPRSVAAPAPAPAPARRAPPRSVARRSASAGRDKRSELRSRYWALLFGDLQRAIGEIYNTVETHENLNECQEVILVLENYTRDFKALGEWFRLKWEYDNTPPPQRPQSLAWEIRKTDFVRPESRRAYSVKSSPSVSGKNSPSLSGHNTPSGKDSPVTGKSSPGSGKISPRISGHATSPKANLEFFSSKVASKIATNPEAKAVKVSRLSDITEKYVKDSPDDEIVTFVKDDWKEETIQTSEQPVVELGKAKECPNISPKQVVLKSPMHIITDNTKSSEEGLTSQAKATTAKLDAMENEFLAKQMVENKAKNDNLLNQDLEAEKHPISIETEHDKPNEKNNTVLPKEISSEESPVKSKDNYADVSNESCPAADESKSSKTEEINTELPKEETEIKLNETSKQLDEIDAKKKGSNVEVKHTNPSEIVKDKDNLKEAVEKEHAKKEYDSKKIEAKAEAKPNLRPAYSQAAAKPKPVSAKPEVKAPVRSSTPIFRSKTIVEMGPNVASKTRQYPKKNQTNKCSYPFNLTTGRPSIFDSTPSAKIVKKPINRNVQMASGDTKTGQNKVEPPKKIPLSPTTLKLNEISDKKEKVNPLEKIKDCEEYSSSDTMVTQLDMSRIESSESLKTLVPEDQIRDVANSVEVLNVDKDKSDNDGWLTVKSRRLNRESKKQSKSHWSNRFHQPSATTSLPTLNMIDSPKQEVNPIIYANKTKLDRAKSEQPRTVKTQRKAEKVKVTVKPKAVSKIKDPAMIRQKSDVTGLKTHSARNKAAKRAEKFKDLNKNEGELIKNRLHSSLESLTTGLARSQESTEDVFDFDKWKDEFKSTYFKYLDEDDPMPDHNEILKTADPSEMSEIAEMTSQIEENEKKLSWALDFQTDVDQRKLCEEEDLLNRQIMELQQVSDIDMDTETDDTETDAEILIEEPHLTLHPAAEQQPQPQPQPQALGALGALGAMGALGALATSLEHQYETALAGMSWAERVDALVVLEALVARDPGRAQQLHAKLSQGIKRRGSLQDALRRLQAKQARAERQRREYQTERAKKIHQLLARVEEVKVAKNQLIEEKRMRMERRLQKAAENRDQHLKDIVRKAHDEEEKLREIAFIKQLEAENRRHEFLEQCRSHTTRLRQMRRDRLSKLEQKAAREAAVGARRAALEAARRRHVAGLLQRRRERDARVDQLKELKKQERGDAAREKAEGVKSRLCALAAAAELEADALRERIRDKQDASQQRLESHLQAIREKCTARQTTSESQDFISKEERELQEEAERLEQERREREKQKAIKKKARKVKQKLVATANETLLIDENTTIEPNNPSTNKLYKVVHQLSNILTPLLDIETNDCGKVTYDITQQNLVNGKGISNTGKLNDDKVNDLIVVDVEVEKNNKKNKGENNKIINGIDVHETTYKNKSKKKKNTDEKHMKNIKIKETITEKDNTPEKDIIITENATTESVTSSSKKKNKKNKNNNEFKQKSNVKEPPKLVKTGSICSSLSDTSKASCRSDRRSKVNIDTTLLERHLNELHRMMEKDKTSTDKAIPQKLLGLKMLGQLVAVVAERDDLTSQFTTKSLTTAITIVSRAISTCAASAAHFIATNMCVHVVRLLTNQLEKELHSDQKETELAKQLSDCLAAALGAVLRATRAHEAGAGAGVGGSASVGAVGAVGAVGGRERGEAQVKGERLVTALRSRAHTLISYLCLCGCVTKAEAAGEVTGNVQTLLTVCVHLCQPCDVDVGTERTSAIQSLRTALGTSICLSRAELCTASNDEQALGEAGRSAGLLRAAAELDHGIVQEAFGEGGWPLEFRAAVARLLAQYAPSDKDAPTSGSRAGVSEREEQSARARARARAAESLVLDLIVLVGFVVVDNPQMQETICEGWSVIKTLCRLPANWLVSRAHGAALLPALAALAQWPAARAHIAAELSLVMLEEFLESPEAQRVKLVQVIKQERTKKTAGKK